MKNKTVNKFFLAFILIIIGNLFIFNDVTYANNKNIKNTLESSDTIKKSIELRYEKVRWYYRRVNGRKQRRLWSLTAGEWLTKWQWVY